MVPKLANSYRTEPEDAEAFNVCAVERAISGVLSTHLQDAKYDAASAPKLAMKLSGLIKSEVKLLNMPRFKVVTQVIGGS